MKSGEIHGRIMNAVPCLESSFAVRGNTLRGRAWGQVMKLVLFAIALCSTSFGQSVIIANSGSTNTAGFQIVVEPSGKAEYTVRPRRRRGAQTEAPETIDKTIPAALVKSLYSDVNRARPLSSLPAPHCAKSVSFGTRRTLQFGEDRSPDLSCGSGGDPHLEALIRDAGEVIKLFRGE
jgi:hypothetical protein